MGACSWKSYKILLGFVFLLFPIVQGCYEFNNPLDPEGTVYWKESSSSAGSNIPATYTVTYHGNGSTDGTVPSDTNRYEAGQTVTVLGNPGNLYRDGYAFTGWNISDDGNGTQYSENSTFTMGSSDIVLFADWELMNLWTWESGSSTINQPGNYGTLTIPDPGNYPGARYGGISWVDSDMNFFLFGGYGYDSSGTIGHLNDVWRYDGTNWTWVCGSAMVDQSGTYGIQGNPDAGNIPGARIGSISWMDAAGNLWLFGGYGYDSSGTAGWLNDMWRYNIDESLWVWVSGSDTGNQAGIYGFRGTADSANIPGSRREGAGWVDSGGNLWLFGGFGYDSAGSTGRLNDLWRYDGTDWTWISGRNTVNTTGIYGVQGIPGDNNLPGARLAGTGWVDGSGNFWLFGGSGFGNLGGYGRLNDLWRYDGTYWTWISGGTVINQTGTYGSSGTAAPDNGPGCRQHSYGWSDDSSGLWLFGGFGYDSSGNAGSLADLWKFENGMWTWVSGSNLVNQPGNYSADETAVPGSRYYGITWIPDTTELWLFGGAGYDSAGDFGALNDLWRFIP